MHIYMYLFICMYTKQKNNTHHTVAHTKKNCVYLYVVYLYVESGRKYANVICLWLCRYQYESNSHYRRKMTAMETTTTTTTAVITATAVIAVATILHTFVLPFSFSLSPCHFCSLTPSFTAIYLSIFHSLSSPFTSWIYIRTFTHTKYG